MNRALLAFNPEAQGDDGGILLFGVAVPRPTHSDGFSAIEELNLASHFLETRPGPAMTALLEHIIHRSSAAHGHPIHAPIAALLLQRLTPAANVVRNALNARVEPPFALSPEGIFGAELEGLSPEDQEFEAARRFVQFADELTRLAASAATSAQSHFLVPDAERLAIDRFAPGLPRALACSSGGFRARRQERAGQ
ncbi:MAG: hypothetical protein ACREE2_04190 [Stellaceae bacterium]